MPADDNPGVVLGVTLGELAKQGRDKVTFITSPAISDLGAWFEQLIAESTGKEGKGIVPIDDEGVAMRRWTASVGTPLGLRTLTRASPMPRLVRVCSTL